MVLGMTDPHRFQMDTDPLGRGAPVVAEQASATAELMALPDANGTIGERLRQIAAIHALANFYAMNPDVPMPRYVMASRTTMPGDGTEHDRVIEVMEFARHVGAETTEDWHHVSARHTVALAAGMRVFVAISAELAPQQPRYISGGER